MTDSIFHGLAIGLSLLASTPPGQMVSTLDFGRSMAYLGRAGWDNENTLQIQGERHLILLRDMELIDEDRRLTPTGHQVRGELTLPVHMSLVDIAVQLNPGGADAVRAAADEEFGAEAAAEPEPPPAPQVAEMTPVEQPDDDDNGYQTAVGLGAWKPSAPPEEPSGPPVVPRPAQPAAEEYETPTVITPPGPPESVPPPAPAGPPPAVAPPGDVAAPGPPPVAAPADVAAPGPAPPGTPSALPVPAAAAPSVVPPGDIAAPGAPSVAPPGDVAAPAAPSMPPPGDLAAPGPPAVPGPPPVALPSD